MERWAEAFSTRSKAIPMTRLSNNDRCPKVLSRPELRDDCYVLGRLHHKESVVAPIRAVEVEPHPTLSVLDRRR